MKDILIYSWTKLNAVTILLVSAGMNSGQRFLKNQKKCQIKKSIIHIITVIMFMLGFSLNGHAQQIFQLDDIISKKLSSSDPVYVSQGQHLQSLVTDLHTTLYLTGGQQKTYGEGAPVMAICDAASVNLLYGYDAVFSQVELIRITVNSSGELPSKLDLTRMKGFTNLQYLFIVFTYDACGVKTDGCLAGLVGGIVQGTDSPVVVIYKLSIPE